MPTLTTTRQELFALRHTNAAVTLKHYQKTLDASLVSAVAGWDDALTSAKVVPIRPSKKSA